VPSTLAGIVAAELARPAPAALEPMLAEIRRRHGAAVAAILFYGSCLRKMRRQARGRASDESRDQTRDEAGAPADTEPSGKMRDTVHNDIGREVHGIVDYDDGVLDFYVLVDSYRSAYDSVWLAWANATLPPNVFYCEVIAGGRTLRAKYAVISVDDFRRGASLAWLQSIIWARFCQPAICVYARDAAAVAAAAAAGVEAALTMVLIAAARLPADAPFRSEDLWQSAFRETYAAELRVESPGVIQEIYAADAARYDRVALEALRELEGRGALRLGTGSADALRVGMDASGRRRLRAGWRMRRFAGKPLAAIRLVKSMATFGDWLPYALWKLERHTGMRIELTAWQRRHPWIACWPVFVRLLRQRVLR
jgi:hypothetical protein